MKRWVWILGAVLILLGGTAEDRRLEHLRPAELLYFQWEDGCIEVRTDQGDLGKGQTAEKALKDLQETAPGIVLADTADKIIIEAELSELAESVAKLLRPSADAYLGVGEIDPEKAAEFLSIHPSGVTLGQIRMGYDKIPVLRGEKGRYELRK